MEYQDKCDCSSYHSEVASVIVIEPRPRRRHYDAFWNRLLGAVYDFECDYTLMTEDEESSMLTAWNAVTHKNVVTLFARSPEFKSYERFRCGWPDTICAPCLLVISAQLVQTRLEHRRLILRARLLLIINIRNELQLWPALRL